jgi:hypothetical protein
MQSTERSQNMKTIFSLMILIMVVQVLSLHISFAQCSVSSNILTENFNSPTGAGSCTGPGDGLSTGTLPTGQTKGAYAASCSGSISITNNVDHCEAAAADVWKTSSNTGNGGGVGNYALFVDPCGSVPNGSIWCKSVSVTAGQKYNFSAMFSSPWEEEKANDPDVYFTIGGVQVGSSLLIEQYTSTGPMPYESYCYTYTIPTSGTMDFCINVKQRTGGTATTPGSGSYGADGQGNDVLVDDIKIDLVTGGGCTSGSACTVTTPVELIIFEAKDLSGGSAFLHWTTASEKDAEYFSVEKSLDGLNFTEIGMVNAKGTSNNIVNYKFDDYHFNKTCYYRLRMVDKDGSYKYSSVQFLETGNNYARVIKTESGEMEIRVSVNEDTRWNIAVYSLLGQEYANQKVRLTKGDNTLLKGISWGEKSAKILRITSEDGEVILSEIIVW